MRTDKIRKRAYETNWKKAHPALQVRIDVDTIAELDEYVKAKGCRSRHRAIVELIEWGLMEFADANQGRETCNGWTEAVDGGVRHTDSGLAGGSSGNADGSRP